MHTERILRILAGFMTLLTLILAETVSKYWLLGTAFVGLNLLQSGFTNWCPAKTILEKLGTKSDPQCGKPKPN